MLIWCARAVKLRRTSLHLDQLLALVTQTLRYLPVIEKLVDNSGLLTVEKKLPRAFALVVVHDVAIAG